MPNVNDNLLMGMVVLLLYVSVTCVVRESLFVTRRL